ncbi:hypothetical protein MSIM_03980 [Mycobacterium simiae]|nr:hypothetical protein MSIM_03980 [Mycobacterium simiae]
MASKAIGSMRPCGRGAFEKRRDAISKTTIDAMNSTAANTTSSVPTTDPSGAATAEQTWA